MQFRQQSDISLRLTRFLAAMAVAAFVYAPDARSDAAPSNIGTVSPADPEGWQARSFKGDTLYRVEPARNGPGLHAIANGTASGLCRPVLIDLGSRPILRWYWRLDRAPPPRNERAKAGDDQGLRLSLLHRPGPTEEESLAVQYVWSQSEPAGARWPNAFVPNAQQLAVRSGPAQPGAWQVEQRDLMADFRAAFGRAVDRVDAVCLMTDGDQTGALVEGWYGDITFQAR